MDSVVDRKGLVQDVASLIRLDKNTASPQQLAAPQVLELAILHHQESQTDQATQLYQAFLKLQQHHTAIWCNLGAALRKQKQYQSAVNCYRRALEIQPSDLTALGNLANALKYLHWLGEAIAIHGQVGTKNQYPQKIKVGIVLSSSIALKKTMTALCHSMYFFHWRICRMFVVTVCKK